MAGTLDSLDTFCDLTPFAMPTGWPCMPQLRWFGVSSHHCLCPRPGMGVTDIGKRLGELWKECDEDDKKK